MARDTVYLVVQSVAIVALAAAVVGLFVQAQSVTTFVIAVAALVVTISAFVLGLPASTRERVTLPRFFRVVFASRTRTIITILATALLIVAVAGHAYPGPSPVATDHIDTTDVSFDLTAPNGTVEVRYTAGPPLDLSGLSVRIDGQPVSTTSSLAIRTTGLSDPLRPGDSIMIVDQTDGHVSWTTVSVTLTTPQNDTVLLATATREQQTVTPRRTTARAAGTISSGGPDPCCSAVPFVRVPHATDGSSYV